MTYKMKMFVLWLYVYHLKAMSPGNTVALEIQIKAGPPPTAYIN